MKYVMKNKDNYFIKDGKDGVNVVFCKDETKSFFINKTARYIFDICDQYGEYEDLLEHLLKKFSTVDSKIIETDLKDFLRLLNIYGIIEFKESIIHWLEDGVFIVGDKEYGEVEKFIKNNFKKNKLSFSYVNDLRYFGIETLRAHTMSNKEYCYGYKDEQIKMTVTIIAPSVESNTIAINSLFFANDIEEREAQLYFEKVLKDIEKTFNTEVGKIRFSLNSSDMPDDSFISLIRKIGFYEESVLKNELKNGNLIMYTKNL